MKITYESKRSRFEALLAFEELPARQALRTAGWRWDPFPVSRWWQTDPERVRPWLRHCDVIAQHKLNGNDFLAHAGIEASRAHDAAIAIPAPPGKAWYPYQRAGIATGLTRPNLLLADEMGLGKTVQAIGIVNVDLHMRRILIICPASLRLNWQREWQAWNTRRIPAVVIRPGTKAWPRQAQAGGLVEWPGCCVIVSYHMVEKWKASILEWQPDMLICDESHNLKNVKAKMTQAVLGFQRHGHPRHKPPIRAARTAFLTGTPVLNRPAELWSTVRRLDPQGLGSSKVEFISRYVDRPDNLDELNERLRASIMVRRQKQDVLTELPPKRRQLVPLDVPNAAELLGLETAALERERQRMAELRRLAQDASGEAYRAAVMKMNQGRQMAMAEIAKARHATAVAKLPHAIEYIREVQEETGKLILFCHHHDVVDGLAAAFPAAVVLDGRTEPTARQAAVDRFQGDPAASIFVGSIRAAGMGLTLTAASTVIFAELDWTPAMMSQAEDRAHRIGQRDSVLVQHLVVDGSIDARMARILVEKQAMLEQVLGDAPPPDAELRRDVLDEVLQGQSALAAD